MNIKLQAERQQMVTARKQAEQELRGFQADYRGKVAQLQRPPQPVVPESKLMQQLRKDADILCAAIRQDEKKHAVADRDDVQQLDMTKVTVARLKGEVAGHEAEIAHLKAMLRNEVPVAHIGGGGSEMLTPCIEGSLLAFQPPVPGGLPAAAGEASHGANTPSSPSGLSGTTSSPSNARAQANQVEGPSSVSPHLRKTPSSDAATADVALADSELRSLYARVAVTSQSPKNAEDASIGDAALADLELRSLYARAAASASVPGPTQARSSEASASEDALKAEYKQYCEAMYEAVSARPSIAGSPAGAKSVQPDASADEKDPNPPSLVDDPASHDQSDGNAPQPERQESFSNEAGDAEADEADDMAALVAPSCTAERSSAKVGAPADAGNAPSTEDEERLQLAQELLSQVASRQADVAAVEESSGAVEENS
jgi:hypothetical protein